MFRGLFDMDKPFWQWIGRIPAMVGLSLCWYICCIPIITIIPASCAIFDAVSRSLMKDDGKGAFRRFFRCFTNELKRGIPLTILWMIVAAVAIYSYTIATQNFEVFSIFYVITGLMLVAYMHWLIPLESRYKNGFIQLHINALRFYFGRLPGSLIMLFSTIGVLVITFMHPYTYFLAAVAPCLIAILHSFQIEKAFQAVFPQDYIDGLPIYTEQESIRNKSISKTEQDITQDKA